MWQSFSMGYLETTIKRPIGKQGENKGGNFKKKKSVVEWAKLVQQKHKEKNDSHLVSFSENQEEKCTI